MRALALLLLLVSSIASASKDCNGIPDTGYGCFKPDNNFPEAPAQPELSYGPVKDTPNNRPTSYQSPPKSPTYNSGYVPYEYPKTGGGKTGADMARELEQNVRRLYSHVNVDLDPNLSIVDELQRLVTKRNEARHTIKKMSYYESRLETIEKATEFLKDARDYYFAKYFDEAKIALKVAETLLDLATSLTPGVSWARDVYESILGKDLHSGEVLDPFSRSMAILGACSLGFGNKAVKAFNVVEKVMKSNHQLDIARKLHHEKSFEELRDTIGFLRKHKIYDPMDAHLRASIANAFMKNSKTRVLTEDLVVYRYYLPGYDPRGAWVTTKLLDNPEQMLALKDTGYLSKSWTIPKGTEILEGIVAPLNERSGGGFQILVNKNYLRE